MVADALHKTAAITCERVQPPFCPVQADNAAHSRYNINAMGDAYQSHDTARRTPLLGLEGVRFGFRNHPNFLGPIGLEVSAGDCWAIVGPNGAGKTSLMRLMAGLVQPTEGTFRLRTSDYGERVPATVRRNKIGQKESGRLSARDRARWVAYVPQHVIVAGRLTAYEVVMLGRYPHRGIGYFETDQDRQAVARAMAMADVAGFADRELGTLSGGEAQRVHLAAALAQEPKLLLLDEPTASLDLEHQLATFELLRDLAVRSKLGVVVATHDLNLAAHFCSQALVLHKGRAVAQGPPGSVFRPEILEPIYSVRMQVLVADQQTSAAPADERHSRRWLVPVERLAGARP